MKRWPIFFRCFLLVLLLCKGSPLPAQTEGGEKKYWHFLKNTGDTKCHLIYTSYHYQYMTPGKISDSGHGGVFSLGLNVARFFSKNIHVGIFGSLKQREIIWPCRFSSGFSNGLSSQVNFSGLDERDSILASAFTTQASKRGSLNGCGRFTWGLSFYLPYKYFPLVRLYKATIVELYDITPEAKAITNDPDWMYFRYHSYGLELTVLHNHLRGHGKDLKVPFSLTFFVERSQYKKARTENIYLDRFVNRDWMNGFSNDTRFGIKLGLEFW